MRLRSLGVVCCVVGILSVGAHPFFDRWVVGSLQSLRQISFAELEALKRFPGGFAKRRSGTVHGLAFSQAKSVSVVPQSCKPLGLILKPKYTGKEWTNVLLNSQKAVFGQKSDWEYDAETRRLSSPGSSASIAFIFNTDPEHLPAAESSTFFYRIFIGDEESVGELCEWLIKNKACRSRDFFFYKDAKGSYNAVQAIDGACRVIAHKDFFSSGAITKIYACIQADIALSVEPLVGFLPKKEILA